MLDSLVVLLLIALLYIVYDIHKLQVASVQRFDAAFPFFPREQIEAQKRMTAQLDIKSSDAAEELSGEAVMPKALQNFKDAASEASYATQQLHFMIESNAAVAAGRKTMMQVEEEYDDFKRDVMSKRMRTVTDVLH